MALALDLDSYEPERIHLAEILLDALHRVCQKLLRMTSEDRNALCLMHPGRADVIGGGAIVASMLADLAEDSGIERFFVRENEILDGIALAIAV